MTNCTCHVNIMSSFSYGFTMTTYGLNDKHGFTCVLYIIAHVPGCHWDKPCFFVKKKNWSFPGLELSIAFLWCHWCCQKLEKRAHNHEPIRSIQWPLFWPGYFFVSVRSWPTLQLLHLEPLMAERQRDLLSSVTLSSNMSSKMVGKDIPIEKLRRMSISNPGLP